MKLNKKVEDELDKQFPKGDKARGRALVLHSIAQIELEKKDKEIKVLEYMIEDLEDKFNIVSGKDAEKFIKNIEHEETRELTKEDKAIIKRFEKFKNGTK